MQLNEVPTPILLLAKFLQPKRADTTITHYMDFQLAKERVQALERIARCVVQPRNVIQRLALSLLYRLIDLENGKILVRMRKFLAERNKTITNGSLRVINRPFFITDEWLMDAVICRDQITLSGTLFETAIDQKEEVN